MASSKTCKAEKKMWFLTFENPSKGRLRSMYTDVDIAVEIIRQAKDGWILICAVPINKAQLDYFKKHAIGET